MSKSISMIIPIFALFWCVVSSSQQHLVCKNIEDVFPDDGPAETQPHYRRVQGPPGKTGPKGERGIRGFRGTEGSPGTVDYDRVDDVIDEKVRNSSSVMNSAISELKRNLSAMLSEWEEWKPRIAELKRKETAAAAAAASEDDCRRREGLLHSGKCLTLYSMSSTRHLNYDQSVAECAKHGALLAEIHDRAQQTSLYEFALTKMPAGISLFYVWMGMEYRRTTSTLLYRSGMEKHSNQFQWCPGAPFVSGKYIVMSVRNDGGSYFGILNDVKEDSLYGVMCEKET